MKALIACLFLLSGCGPLGLTALRDFFQGEADTTNQIIIDLNRPDPLHAPYQGPVMKMPPK